MPDETDAFVPLSDERSMRQAVGDLLIAWEAGGREPAQVFADARALWLSRRWPQPHEKGFDLAAADVLFMLASARDAALTDRDIPALRSYLEAKGQRGIERARDRFAARLEATSDERDAMQGRDDYYGALPTDGVDEPEFAISDPDARRLHRAMRLDPEAGWPDLRARLCQRGPRDELFLFDLVEDLISSHADQFIARIEELADECPLARQVIAHAHVGGLASSAGLERFWELQQRLAGDAERPEHWSNP